MLVGPLNLCSCCANKLRLNQRGLWYNPSQPLTHLPFFFSFLLLLLLFFFFFFPCAFVVFRIDFCEEMPSPSPTTLRKKKKVSTLARRASSKKNLEQLERSSISFSFSCSSSSSPPRPLSLYLFSPLSSILKFQSVSRFGCLFSSSFFSLPFVCVCVCVYFAFCVLFTFSLTGQELIAQRVCGKRCTGLCFVLILRNSFADRRPNPVYMFLLWPLIENQHRL